MSSLLVMCVRQCIPDSQSTYKVIPRYCNSRNRNSFVTFTRVVTEPHFISKTNSGRSFHSTYIPKTMVIKGYIDENDINKSGRLVAQCWWRRIRIWGNECVDTCKNACYKWYLCFSFPIPTTALLDVWCLQNTSCKQPFPKTNKTTAVVLNFARSAKF